MAEDKEQTRIKIFKTFFSSFAPLPIYTYYLSSLPSFISFSHPLPPSAFFFSAL